jgi:hypothetical protein
MAFMIVVAGIPGAMAILIFAWAYVHLVRGLVRGDYSNDRR